MTKRSYMIPWDCELFDNMYSDPETKPERRARIQTTCPELDVKAFAHTWTIGYIPVRVLLLN